jgi:SAM-dependent methyltransferase
MIDVPKRTLAVIPSPGEPRTTARRAELHAVPPLPEADDFDRLMDAEARRLSAIHWTPTRVCHRAVQLLSVGEGDRVLDVGSGVGKLCVLGSLISHASFLGVEQRLPLVAQARRLAAYVGSKAEFIHGDAFDVDWSGFQAIYLYNPFDEARFASSWQIDGSIQTGVEVFDRLVHRTQLRLAGLAPGTRVVTFHGLGGPMPGGYERLVGEPIADGALELWTRTR